MYLTACYMVINDTYFTMVPLLGQII